VVARLMVYAGWAAGLVGLVLVTADERLAGLILIPAALLLAGAAGLDVAGELRFGGNRRFLNLVLGFIGICWIVLGAALVA
jgi:hypothetical protein